MNGETKFYPSSAGFAVGSQIFTEWSSSCPRNIFLSHNGVRQPFPEANKNAGQKYEDLVAERWADKDYEKEVPFKVKDQFGFTISGRIDYVRKGEIWELKSCNSSGSRTKHLTHGEITVGNLAQIATYMFSVAVGNGNLQYGEMKTNKKTSKVSIGREVTHKITLTSSGTIVINGDQSQYGLVNLLTHRKLAAEAIFEGKLGNRPYNESKFKGPCSRCLWNEACNKVDNGLSAPEFVQTAKEILHGKSETVSE